MKRLVSQVSVGGHIWGWGNEVNISRLWCNSGVSVLILTQKLIMHLALRFCNKVLIQVQTQVIAVVAETTSIFVGNLFENDYS
jgi:hypothetical protein